MADLWNLPHDLSGLDIQCAEELLTLRYVRVVDLITGRRGDIKGTSLERHHVIEPRERTVRRRHPVGRAFDGRAANGSVMRRDVLGKELRTPVRADAARPRQLVDKLRPQEKLAARAVEDIEEPIAIGMEEQFAILAM